ncbi:sulfotransferase [Neiella marina]|uniref:Sulfotransferase n=1 Tax=Neiella marina TaxID=508461 RepID=A0A8J2U7M5_9GAMM|nr:sulfotransferase [Neiella marina]GGA84348.1 sulfotransferase [Neiella marina]
MLPNVIVIGAMKCGTSSLHRYLDAHPNIAMTKKKEIDFFIDRKNWTKGQAWYEAQFDELLSQDSKIEIVGESSPNYTMFPTFEGVPQRMAAMVPDAKLIYVVRDPIERIKSHYQHQWYDGRKSQTLEQVLQTPERKHYISTSRYYQQIEQFLSYYKPNQLLVLTVEQLKSDRDATMQRVFEFLGVDSTISVANLAAEFHRTSDKVRVSGPLSFLQSKSATGAKFRQTVRAIVPKIWIKKMGQLLTKKPDVELSHETLTALKEDLAEDASKLREFSGLSLDTWSV